MDDYLSEREQWESIKLWIRQNGLWIVAGIAVAALGMSGLSWYRGHADQRGAQASAKYGQVLQAFGSADRTRALVLLGELERDYAPSPYLDQAKLAAARAYVESGDLEKAAGELQAVADHSKDAELALLARLRLARVQIAQKKADLALTTLNGIQPGAFASRYHEIRGDAYYAKGDKANALKEYFSAKAGDLLGGSPEGGQLDLKIADLSGETQPAAVAATK